MKKRIKDKLNIGTLFSFITAAVCVLMLLNDLPFCRTLLEKAAVFSAKTVLVTAETVKKEEAVYNNEHETQVEDEAHSESESQTDAYEETTQSTTEEKKPDEAQAASGISQSDFTAEPEDIRRLVEKYSQNADKDKKDGAITEITYKNSGVTDSYKNIKVKNVNDTGINIKKLIAEKPDIKITDKSKPTVLIYHTHTTEAYQILDRSFYARGYTSRSEDSSKNMVRVGDEICAQLEKAGFAVIHDTQIYDKMYNGAYKRSRVTVEDYLKKYPSIQVTLDIHRDAIQYNNGTKAKPVSEIMGKKCAQMMIISGCQESGNGIAGFDDWEQNLVFALHLQNRLEDMFPGIMRPLYFCPRRYNMDLNHCSLLIEMGSDANTLGEAVYAGKCLGAALASLLENYCE